MHDLYSEMQQRYEDHDLPWDVPLPPPEVLALAERLAPGRALDLGCGAGRTAIYLAQRGWQCDGVDFVPRAVAVAQARAHDAGVADHARFHLGSVTQMDFLDGPYDLAIDIGCLHAQRGADLQRYRAEVTRLLRPAGYFLLFGRVLANPDPTSTRGLTLSTIRMLFAESFVVDRVEHGTTYTGGNQWPSAWFWMRRRVPEGQRPAV